MRKPHSGLSDRRKELSDSVKIAENELRLSPKAVEKISGIMYKAEPVPSVFRSAIKILFDLLQQGIVTREDVQRVSDACERIQTSSRMDYIELLANTLTAAEEVDNDFAKKKKKKKTEEKQQMLPAPVIIGASFSGSIKGWQFTVANHFEEGMHAVDGNNTEGKSKLLNEVKTHKEFKERLKKYG